jgi:hypothetical protein
VPPLIRDRTRTSCQCVLLLIRTAWIAAGRCSCWRLPRSARQSTTNVSNWRVLVTATTAAFRRTPRVPSPTPERVLRVRYCQFAMRPANDRYLRSQDGWNRRNGRSRPRPWTPQLGGERAYKSRLSKDRNACQSCHSVATANQASPPLRKFEFRFVANGPERHHCGAGLRQGPRAGVAGPSPHEEKGSDPPSATAGCWRNSSCVMAITVQLVGLC